MAQGDRASEAGLRRPAASGGARPPWRGLAALAFVAVTLLLLVAMPAYYGETVAEAQARIADIVEPAAQRSSNLSLLLSRQMARMDGYLLTGNRPQFREPYIATITEKDSLLGELRDLARGLERDERDEVFERVAQLALDWARWDLANQDVFDRAPDAETGESVRRGFTSLQLATRELDRAILSVVSEARREMADARAAQSRTTVALAVLALFGTLLLGRIGYRYRDLTLEREMRRREAVRARREIDALLEATDDGVLGVDLDGRCITLNRAGSDLLGYTESEIRGRDIHATLFHSHADGSPSPRGESPVLAAIAAGEPLDSRDGDVLWRRRRIPFPARWSLRPLLDGIELRGAVLTFTDMTEIREKEEALRRAIRQREDVVSIVSHDLRNPLGVVLAAADLLLDLPLEEEQRRRQAEIILRSGRRMQSLIEDLLDVARIEAGALVVRPSLEETVPLLDEARDLFADQADKKGIDLRVELGRGAFQARIDRDRVLQALANLVDNAIRHTPEGGCVTLGVAESGPDLLVSVRDTGVGIDPERVDHIFDRFHQVAGAGGGGAGLGLAIVAGVAAAHDGDASVESVPGQGSTFTLRLPRSGPHIADESAPRG